MMEMDRIDGIAASVFDGYLVRKDLVERRRSLEDQRAFELFLTASGHACFDRVVSVDDTFMDSVLTGLSPVEIDTFTRLLRKIENNVSD